MKKFSIVFLIALMLSFSSVDSYAKRLGGSKSMGRQSTTVTQKQAAPAQPAAPAANPAPATTPAPAAAPAPVQKRFGWGGMLGGLAAGLGLGWLLSHFGLGEAAASFFMGTLLLMVVAIAGLWIFRKFAAPSERYQPAGQMPSDTGYARVEPAVATSSSGVIEPTGITGFDQEQFLLNAKKYFVRLQDAWDSGDVSQLREFTTREMAEELERDLSARIGTNRTEVLTLDAELLGVETMSDSYLASVRFSGMIREQSEAAAESFVEVWNLIKPTDGGGGWVLAGIQQLA